MSKRTKTAVFALILVALLAMHVAWATHFWSGVYIFARYSAPYILLVVAITLAALTAPALAAMR